MHKWKYKLITNYLENMIKCESISISQKKRLSNMHNSDCASIK